MGAGGSGSGGSGGVAGSDNGGSSGSAGQSGTGGDAGSGGSPASGGDGGQGGTTGNLLLGSGFETATTEGWHGRGNASVSISTDYAHTGAYSLAVTGRTTGWHGAEYNVLPVTTSGITYRATAWVQLFDASPPSTMILTRQLRPNTGACPINEFGWIDNSYDITPGSWIELTGTFTVPADCDPTLLAIYVESANPTVAYYIDDVFFGIEP
jgi:endo-1,4-beta-xylanase